jgi:protease II
VGAAWLARGGVKVIANIRGGGEYGPRWHQAALREKRPRAYEDFEAVAADLIARGVCSPDRLGCVGGSNGGLLTGNMITRRGRGLFGAVLCQVMLPLHPLHSSRVLTTLHDMHAPTHSPPHSITTSPPTAGSDFGHVQVPQSLHYI